MSFIELPGINDVKEKVAVPEGIYDLVITDNPQPKRNENSGKVNLLVVIAIEGYPDAANLLFNLSLPAPEDEQQSRDFKMLQIRRFCNLFNINVDNGLNTEEFAGARASAANVIQEPVVRKGPSGEMRETGEIRNNLVLPPLPHEE